MNLIIEGAYLSSVILALAGGFLCLVGFAVGYAVAVYIERRRSP